jgi:hypothetical protein
MSSLEQFLLFQDVEFPRFLQGNLERGGGQISINCRNGAVWLDLIEEKLDGRTRLRLGMISYDGFGCCNLIKNKIKLPYFSAENTARIKELLRPDQASEELDRIFCRYLYENRDEIWDDALIEHKLIPE